MSWRAMRYQKRVIRIAESKRKRRDKIPSFSRHGALAPRVIQEDVLVRIFRLASVHRALRTCNRLQQWKRRIPSVTMPEKRFRKKGFADRNYHHLTPRCRRGQPYHGEGLRNLLLIRVGRHEAWHKVFGVLTLEEVITALMLCAKLNYELWVISEYCRRYPRKELPMRRDIKLFRSQVLPLSSA